MNYFQWQTFQKFSVIRKRNCNSIAMIAMSRDMPIYGRISIGNNPAHF